MDRTGRRAPAGPDGVARARELARMLRCFHPARLVSATPVRCRQTLVPLAEATGLAGRRRRGFRRVGRSGVGRAGACGGSVASRDARWCAASGS